MIETLRRSINTEILWCRQRIGREIRIHRLPGMAIVGVELHIYRPPDTIRVEILIRGFPAPAQ